MEKYIFRYFGNSIPVKTLNFSDHVCSSVNGPHSTAINPTRANKSDSPKYAQIVRFKERVNALEERVRSLQEENELLYGKLSTLRG